MPKPTRASFCGAVTGAAAVAMPQVLRAQTATLKMQGACHRHFTKWRTYVQRNEMAAVAKIDLRRRPYPSRCWTACITA
jgi:hypothetical protein